MDWQSAAAGFFSKLFTVGVPPCLEFCVRLTEFVFLLCLVLIPILSPGCRVRVLGLVSQLVSGLFS